MPPKDLRAYFRAVSKEDHEQHTATGFQELRELDHGARFEEERKRKADHERELARQRKRRERERKANPVPTRVVSNAGSSTAQAISLDSDTDSGDASDESETTRELRLDPRSPDTAAAEAEAAAAAAQSLVATSSARSLAAASSMVSATSTDSTQSAKKTNWVRYFDIIDEAARKVRWKSTRAIAQQLKIASPEVFEKLAHSTINTWLAPDRKSWSDDFIERVDRYRALTGVVTRSHTFKDYPELDEAIASQLRGYRADGVPVCSAVARAVIIKHVTEKAPQLLTGPFPSDAFVFRYLKKVLRWSYRAGTRPFRTKREGWEIQCREVIHRIVLTMEGNSIPPSLVINGDQAGVELFPTGNRSWNPTGAKQVDIAGLDDKKYYTLMVSSAMDGTFLPFQAVFAGTTARSLPRDCTPATSKGILFSHGGNNHWSDHNTTVQWVEEVIVPYIERVKARDNLPAHQPAILYIDCWGSHRDPKFTGWLMEKYPQIIIRFVPGGCTGDVQPADVGLQRLVKHEISRRFSTWFARAMSNLEPNDIQGFKALTQIGSLRDQVPSLLSHTYDVFCNKRNLVQLAWRKSKIDDLDLGAEYCLSQAGIAAAKAYQAMNPRFSDTLSRAAPPPKPFFPISGKHKPSTTASSGMKTTEVDGIKTADVDGTHEDEIEQQQDDISMPIDTVGDAIFNVDRHGLIMEPDGSLQASINDEAV